MQKEQYVICVGSGVVDNYFTLPHWPKLGVQIVARPIGKYVGGLVSNACNVLAGYGAHTYLMGMVDTTPDGQFVLDTLKAGGVDMAYYRQDKNYTACVCNIYLVDGERTIFVGIPEEHERFSFTPEQIEGLCGAAYIYTTLDQIEGIENGYEVIAKAKACGATVCVDMESYQPDEIHQKYLPLCDIIFVNDHDFEVLSGGKDELIYCKTLLENGAKLVVITKGSKGGSVYSKDMLFDYPAFPVKAIDTTGAGDTFNASFVYGLLQGMCLKKAAVFAAAAAARAVTQLGPQGGVTDVATVQDFMQSYGQQ